MRLATRSCIALIPLLMTCVAAAQATHKDFDGGCAATSCSPGPLVVTPSAVKACRGETVSLDVYIEGNRLSVSGHQNYPDPPSGGTIDWGLCPGKI